LIGTLVGCVLALPLMVNAKPAGKTYRIGYLHPATSQDPGGAFSALKQALADLGYLAGRNVKFEERFADGKLERLPSLAAELVTLKIDVLVAVSPSAIRAARDATATIPIVMAFSGDDPVKSGFVASLARPGGNITGMTSVTSELAPKWIELFQDAMPGIQRIAVLRSPLRPDHTEQVQVMQAAARRSARGRGSARSRAVPACIRRNDTPARRGCHHSLGTGVRAESGATRGTGSDAPASRPVAVSGLRCCRRASFVRSQYL
jgi:putative ABC transport system substrate-binding protein